MHCNYYYVLRTSELVRTQSSLVRSTPTDMYNKANRADQVERALNYIRITPTAASWLVIAMLDCAFKPCLILQGAYKHFLAEGDEARLEWVRLFNQYDLYTKDQQNALDPKVLLPYYLGIAEKYNLGGVLRW